MDYFFDPSTCDWELGPFHWLVFLGGLMAFVSGCGTGSNDLANSFATPVGARIIPMKKALVLGFFCELLGALFLGDQTPKTIRKSVADPACFESDPAVLMYAMLCALAGASVWFFVAWKHELAISSTHAVLGAIIGVTLVSQDHRCVNWFERSDYFPFVGGVSAIFSTIVLVTVLSGLVAATIYVVIRNWALRSQVVDSFSRVLKLTPVLVGLTFALTTAFVIRKGGKRFGAGDLSDAAVSAVAVGVGALAALVSVPLLVEQVNPRAPVTKFIRHKFEMVGHDFKDSLGHEFTKQAKSNHSKRRRHQQERRSEPIVTFGENSRSSDAVTSSERNSDGSVEGQEVSKAYVAAMLEEMDHMLEDIDDRAREIHLNAERFSPESEFFLGYLVLLTAVCSSVVHGGSAVANATTPFVTIYKVFTDGVVAKESDMGNDMYWALLIGGLGVATGALLFGSRLIITLGVKLTKISPTRAIAIQLGSMFVIVVASALEWPVSTTYCQVGATIGVALSESRAVVNWQMLRRTVLGWVLTFPFCGIVAAGLFAYGVYTPTIVASDTSAFVSECVV